VDVQLALLDRDRVGVGLGERHLGVVDGAERALEQLAVLQHPVVVDVALRPTRDDVLHARRRARALGLIGGELALQLEPVGAEELRHPYAPTRSRTPANRSSSKPSGVGTRLRARM